MSKEKADFINGSEIDLLKLIQYFWSKKWRIAKITSVFVLLGLIIGFTSSEEFEAGCRIIPESKAGLRGGRGGFGGFSSLAGLAGINLNLGENESITPVHYPDIVRSVPFQLELINEPVYYSKLDTTISSMTYFKEYNGSDFLGLLLGYTIGLPVKIKNLIFNKDEVPYNVREGDNDLLRLSKLDWAFIKAFSARINIESNEYSGIINVTVEMPDKYAAAKIADLLVKKLTENVTLRKTKKAKDNLEFIQDRFDEAETKYLDKQVSYANFVDRNRNLSNRNAGLKAQILQNELSLSFEVYKGLASQLEQAKIKLKQAAPVFTIVEPVRIPEDKSKPRKFLILAITTFLGIIVSLVWVLFSKK